MHLKLVEQILKDPKYSSFYIWQGASGYRYIGINKPMSDQILSITDCEIYFNRTEEVLNIGDPKLKQKIIKHLEQFI